MIASSTSWSPFLSRCEAAAPIDLPHNAHEILATRRPEQVHQTSIFACARRFCNKCKSIPEQQQCPHYGLTCLLAHWLVFDDTSETPLQVLSRSDMAKIMRLHLARVLPGSFIRIHRDQGGYVERGHRIHVPLQADPSTLAFLSCPTARPHAISPAVTAPEALRQGCLPLQIEEGLVNSSEGSVLSSIPCNQSSTPGSALLNKRPIRIKGA
jgi:hypothetical protein